MQEILDSSGPAIENAQASVGPLLPTAEGATLTQMWFRSHMKNMQARIEITMAETVQLISS